MVFFFFFRRCFFFPALWNRVSEWRVNFSWEKKKKNNFWQEKKKKQRKKWNSTKGAVFYRFWPFLEFSVSQLSEWHANFSWEKKKTACFFFFPKHGKKKTKIAQSEWVSTPQSFPGKKKKTIPLVKLAEI